MTDDRMRLDIWLWRARFFKTRSAAADAILEAGIRIERDGKVRRIEKPATSVAAGDLLSFATPSAPCLLRVVSLPERRGPAAEASQCYVYLSISIRDEQGEAYDQGTGQRSRTADRT